MMTACGPYLVEVICAIHLVVGTGWPERAGR